jgi:uncharacterized protein
VGQGEGGFECSLQAMSPINIFRPMADDNHYLYCMEMLSVIRQKLEQLKPELVAKYHVRTIGLFGSVVRNDFTDESDIDIIVDFSQPVGIEFIYLADELELKLNRKVDLVSRNGIKQAWFQRIEPQIIYV